MVARNGPDTGMKPVQERAGSPLLGLFSLQLPSVLLFTVPSLPSTVLLLSTSSCPRPITASLAGVSLMPWLLRCQRLTLCLWEI